MPREGLILHSTDIGTVNLILGLTRPILMIAGNMSSTNTATQAPNYLSPSLPLSLFLSLKRLSINSCDVQIALLLLGPSAGLLDTNHL